MNSVSVQEVQKPEAIVIRTYHMGVKFHGSKEDKRIQEIEANQRIKGLQVQQEDIAFNRLAKKTAMDLARKYPRAEAKRVPSEISKTTKNSRNITKSAYYWLFVAAKGAYDREKKVADFFNYLLQNHDQALEWAIFGRSPRAELYFTKKWKASRLYVINLINRTRRQIDKFCPPQLKFNTKLPLLTQKEIEGAIQKCNKYMSMQLTTPDMTNQAQTFVNTLRLLAINTSIVAPHLTAWNNLEHTSRWRSIRLLNKTIAEAIGKPHRVLFSALRTIIVFALFPDIGKTAIKLIKSTRPEEVVNPPFHKKKKGRIPIILLMKDRLVVMRPGNSEHMTFLAKANGEFDIGFLLKDHPRITATLVISKKVLRYLANGARIRVLYIRSSPAPSYKVRVAVVLEGPVEVFLSTKLTKQFAKRMRPPKEDEIGLDVNRIGKHMLALSNGVKLAKEFDLLIEKYQELTKKTIPEMHHNLTMKGQKKKSNAYIKAKGELARIYQRKFRIKKEIFNMIPHFLASVMIKSKCKTFFVEDLEIDQRGRKGALAIAISSMPKNMQMIEKAVQLASNVLGYEVKLVKVDARGTSRKHNICGGTIERTLKRYDRAKCRKCGKTIDTHINSAKNVRDKGVELLRLKTHPSTHTRGMGSNQASESEQSAEV